MSNQAQLQFSVLDQNLFTFALYRQSSIARCYLVCGFRYSVYYSKKLFWQFEVEGLQDEKKERERETLNDIAEFAQDSFDVDNAVKNVRVFWDDFIRFS